MKFHTARLKFWYGYLLMFGLLAVFIFSMINSAWELSFISLVLGLVSLLIFELFVHIHRGHIGEHEIVLIEGLLSRKVIKVHVSNITDVSVHQTFLERIFGFGDIHISTGGSDSTEIILHAIPHPQKIEAILSKSMHEHKHGAKRVTY